MLQRVRVSLSCFGVLPPLHSYLKLKTTNNLQTRLGNNLPHRNESGLKPAHIRHSTSSPSQFRFHRNRVNTVRIDAKIKTKIEETAEEKVEEKIKAKVDTKIGISKFLILRTFSAFLYIHIVVVCKSRSA